MCKNILCLLRKKRRKSERQQVYTQHTYTHLDNTISVVWNLMVTIVTHLPTGTSTWAMCVSISCTVQKVTSSHLALFLTATGNYQCFILTGFDVLKQGCTRTTVSKAQHWASSNSSASSELSVLNQLSDLFIWLELVPKKKEKLLPIPASSLRQRE